MRGSELRMQAYLARSSAERSHARFPEITADEIAQFMDFDEPTLEFDFDGPEPNEREMFLAGYEAGLEAARAAVVRGTSLSNATVEAILKREEVR